MRELERYELASINVLPINHSFDAVRTSGQSILKSHNANSTAATMLSRLHDVFEMKEYSDAVVIGIDECQFFPDLYDSVLRMVNQDGKIVYLAGLDGTYEKKKFGQILDLIPECDTVRKLAGVCKQCAKLENAIFTQLCIAQETKDSNSVLIGGADKYQAVCRRHFVPPCKTE